MGIQSSLEQACDDVRLLRQAIDELTVAILEDRPREWTHSDVTELEDHAREMPYLCKEFQKVLREACGDCGQCGQPLNEGLVRRGLENCGSLFARLLELFVGAHGQARCLSGNIVTAGKAAGEWQLWVEVVQTDLARCLPLLGQCTRSLLKCWAEIAERLSPLPNYLLATR